MEQSKSKRLCRFWAGAICVVAASWLGMAFWFQLVLSLFMGDTFWQLPALDIEWIDVSIVIGLLVLVVAITFVILSAVAGMICAFFWHPVATVADYERWGFWVWLLAVAPAILLFGLGLLVFLPSLVTFYKALDYGVQWWPAHRWRQFFGMANDWERDADEPKTP